MITISLSIITIVMVFVALMFNTATLNIQRRRINSLEKLIQDLIKVFEERNKANRR